MIARALIAAVLLVVPAYFFVRWLLNSLEHRALMTRMEKFSAWSATVPRMPEMEKAAAMALMLQVVKSEGKHDYRGPWEKIKL